MFNVILAMSFGLVIPKIASDLLGNRYGVAA
jgi:hypothetical protein